MPYRKRSTRRKAIKVFKKATIIFVIFMVVLTAGILMLSSIFAKDGTGAKQKAVVVAKAVIEEADAESEIEGKYYGLCKKNSIHSVADFRKAVEQDPILAGHFSGFNWDNARMGRLEESLLTFVSYRKDDIIRRTSKPLRLPKGDEYITDGVHRVRTLCCNDYDIAAAPIEASEAEQVVDPPQVDSVTEMLADANVSSLSLPDSLIKSAESIDQPAPLDESTRKPTSHLAAISSPTLMWYSSAHPVQTASVVTPEPGTFWLVVSGGLAVGVGLRLKRRRKVA